MPGKAKLARGSKMAPVRAAARTEAKPVRTRLPTPAPLLSLMKNHGSKIYVSDIQFQPAYFSLHSEPQVLFLRKLASEYFWFLKHRRTCRVSMAVFPAIPVRRDGNRRVEEGKFKAGLDYTVSPSLIPMTIHSACLLACLDC